MYLLFVIRPEGTPAIGDGSYLSPTKCQEGWFVLETHEQICIDNDWTDYTKVDEITMISDDNI